MSNAQEKFQEASEEKESSDAQILYANYCLGPTETEKLQSFDVPLILLFKMKISFERNGQGV